MDSLGRFAKQAVMYLVNDSVHARVGQKATVKIESLLILIISNIWKFAI